MDRPAALMIAIAAGLGTRTAYGEQPSFAMRTADRVCDLDDRVVLVKNLRVTVFQRPSLQRTDGSVSKREQLDDRCDGWGGGHAGCSIHYDRFWSPALGPTMFLEFGNNVGDGVFDESSPNVARLCRADAARPVTATCSTATRYVVVTATDRGLAWTAAVARPVDLGAGRSAGTPDRWVIRFRDGDAALSLTFDRVTKTATLRRDALVEPCVAFTLGAPSS